MKLHLPFYYKQGNYIKEMTSEQCGGLFNFFTPNFFYYQVYRQSIKSWNKSIIACMSFHNNLWCSIIATSTHLGNTFFFMNSCREDISCLLVFSLETSTLIWWSINDYHKKKLSVISLFAHVFFNSLIQFP